MLIWTKTPSTVLAEEREMPWCKIKSKFSSKLINKERKASADEKYSSYCMVALRSTGLPTVPAIILLRQRISVTERIKSL